MYYMLKLFFSYFESRRKKGIYLKMNLRITWITWPVNFRSNRSKSIKVSNFDTETFQKERREGGGVCKKTRSTCPDWKRTSGRASDAGCELYPASCRDNYILVDPDRHERRPSMKILSKEYFWSFYQPIRRMSGHF